MSEKERKVGCPFCSRESNRPNNVVVHIMGQHQNLCKEKISRIRSRVPAVAMREAMLLFMKDKIESDEKIRQLLEDNERLKWGMASGGGIPASRGGSSYATFDRDQYYSGPAKESSNKVKMEKISKRKRERDPRGRGGEGRKKRRNDDDDDDDDDDDEAEEEREEDVVEEEEAEEEEEEDSEDDGRDSIRKGRLAKVKREKNKRKKKIKSLRVSQQDKDSAGGMLEVCLISWKEHLLCISSVYLDFLTADDSDPHIPSSEAVFLIVNSKGGGFSVIGLEELRKIFPSGSDLPVQRCLVPVEKASVFDKLLADVFPQTPSGQYKIVGTMDSCLVQTRSSRQTLIDKLIAYGLPISPTALELADLKSSQYGKESGSAAASSNADFIMHVEAETKEWEQQNPVEKFGRFLVSLPKSFADILLTMHPILENIALAKVEETSFLQRITRILHLLSQSKDLIGAKIAEYKRQLGSVGVKYLEDMLALAEGFSSGLPRDDAAGERSSASVGSETTRQDMLRQCMQSFVGMKRVLSSLCDELHQIVPNEGDAPSPFLPAGEKQRLPAAAAARQPPALEFSAPREPSYFGSQRFDSSSSGGNQKRSFAFTQAMSRLLNAIQMCNSAEKPRQPVPSGGSRMGDVSPPAEYHHPPPPAPQVPHHSSMTQQPQPPSLQHMMPSPYMTDPSLYSSHPSIPMAPIISRPVPVTIFPALQPGGGFIPATSQQKLSSHEYGSAFTPPTSRPPPLPLPPLHSHTSSAPATAPRIKAEPTSFSDASHDNCASVYRTTHVFVIALERFTDRTLFPRPGAIEDARLVETALNRWPGYTVHTILNEDATKRNLRNIFDTELAASVLDDRVLVLFESQGIQTTGPGGEDIGVMCCYDTDASNPLESGIQTQELLKWIPNARHIALFLDCPFAGAGLPPFADSSSSTPSWQQLVAKPASQYLWSGELRGGRSGVFITYIIDALGGAVFDHYQKDWVRMSELSEWVCNGVFRATKGRQEPQGGKVKPGSFVGGEVLFLRPGVTCLPIAGTSTASPHASSTTSTTDSGKGTNHYLTLSVKEMRYYGFVGSDVSQTIAEKHKVMIVDEANEICVGQAECLERTLAIMTSVEEYIMVLRAKAPHLRVTAQELLQEIQRKEADGPMYTITVPCTT